jgi:hypothetical protein
VKTDRDPVIECPCYRICSALGVKTSTWCRYRKSAAPPVGMHRFDPQETWCPGGVQANVIMLGYMIVGQNRDPKALAPALAKVREWAATLRPAPHSYDPAGH